MTGESQPTNKGAIIYGVCLTDDFALVIHRIADRENRLPSDILLDLARDGAECRRLHGEKGGHSRMRK